MMIARARYGYKEFLEHIVVVVDEAILVSHRCSISWRCRHRTQKKKKRKKKKKIDRKKVTDDKDGEGSGSATAQ